MRDEKWGYGNKKEEKTNRHGETTKTNEYQWFAYLASKGSSVKDAALEKIVTELREVQKEYDRLKDKGNLVDDDGRLKLNAQIDDGLDNCASSLRYAVHYQERFDIAIFIL